MRTVLSRVGTNLFPLLPFPFPSLKDAHDAAFVRTLAHAPRTKLLARLTFSLSWYTPSVVRHVPCTSCDLRASRHSPLLPLSSYPSTCTSFCPHLHHPLIGSTAICTRPRTTTHQHARRRTHYLAAAHPPASSRYALCSRRTLGAARQRRHTICRLTLVHNSVVLPHGFRCFSTAGFLIGGRAQGESAIPVFVCLFPKIA